MLTKYINVLFNILLLTESNCKQIFKILVDARAIDNISLMYISPQGKIHCIKDAYIEYFFEYFLKLK